MNLDDFHSDDAGLISYTREQASRFAKEVAGDFNPIHNPDSKMFCVPGDLLFATTLAKRGLRKTMCFKFSGMVKDDPVHITETDKGINLVDSNDKACLEIECSGDNTDNAELIQKFTEAYVAFSGRTFPHILLPLMADKDIMINPRRPMVMYLNMTLELTRLDMADVSLDFTGADVEVEGKKGTVALRFNVMADGEVVGTGSKNMALRGLMAYDKDAMDALAEGYEADKAAYLAAQA